MNNNNFSQITDQQTMTSMQIAEITGKNHYDVLKAIRKMEPAWESVAEGKFSVCSYMDGNQRPRPMYVLTKTECLFVATKFNDEARAKLVLRWEQLEKERLTQTNIHSTQTNCHSSHLNEDGSPSNLPMDPRNMTRKQLLLMALEAEEENERLQQKVDTLESDNYGLMLENGQKDEQIKVLEERTSYLNAIMADNSTVTVSQIAQDYGMGAPSFNNLLKGLGIQRRVGAQWILYAEHLNKGYVATRMIPIHHSGGYDTYKPLTSWTQTGRRFLYEKLKKHGVLPLIERGRQQNVQQALPFGTSQGQSGGAA